MTSLSPGAKFLGKAVISSEAFPGDLASFEGDATLGTGLLAGTGLFSPTDL